MAVMKMKSRKPAAGPVPLLTQVDTVRVPGVERFEASHFFGQDNPAGINFFLAESFRRNFLTKVEENVSVAALGIHCLNREADDHSIRKVLTPRREEMTLAWLFELFKFQPKGELGILLTNGWANLAYIPNVHDQLMSVRGHWFSARNRQEWLLCAFDVESSIPWSAGRLVISRQ